MNNSAIISEAFNKLKKMPRMKDSKKSLKESYRKRLKEGFVKLNDEPIEIDYIETDDVGYVPMFKWDGKRYNLNDFIRCHNNPWGEIDCPDYIHAYDSSQYYNPIFIGLDDSGEYLDVYEQSDEMDESCGRRLKESDNKGLRKDYNYSSDFDKMDSDEFRKLSKFLHKSGTDFESQYSKLSDEQKQFYCDTIGYDRDELESYFDSEINESYKRRLKEGISKKEFINAYIDSYGGTVKDASKQFLKWDESSKKELVNGFKNNSKKSFLTDSLKEDMYSSGQFSIGDKVVAMTDMDNLRKTGFTKYRNYTGLNGKVGTIIYKNIDTDNVPYFGEWDGQSYIYRVEFSDMPKNYDSFKLPGALLKPYNNTYNEGSNRRYLKSSLNEDKSNIEAERQLVLNAIIDYLEDKIEDLPDYIYANLDIDPEMNTYNKDVSDYKQWLDYLEEQHLAVVNLADVLVKPYIGQ